MMFQKFCYQIYCIPAILVFRHQGTQPGAGNFREFKFHVGRLFFVLLNEVFRGGSDNVMNSYYLVILVVTRKERYKCQHLVNDTANAPHVHFVRVVTIGHKAFGRTVPPCRDVFGARLGRVDSSARAEVCEFHQIILD